MSILYAYATRPHYANHMTPILKVLETRGHEIVYGSDAGRQPDPGDVCMVASRADMEHLPGRRLIYVEHGAGQTYSGVPDLADAPGYPGGRGHGDVALFVCPSQRVAEMWAARYPDAAVAVVGCPMLDQWHQNPPKPDPTRPVIGITFHWPSSLCEEAGTAWWVYQRAVDELVRECLTRGWGLLGHEHPRWDGQMLDNWKMRHIPVATYAEVMNQATVLVADNSSMIPEFASTGRPVVFLNTPDYRRDVDHGARFWRWADGQVSVNDPIGLIDGIRLGIADPPEVQAARQRMVNDVYAFVDGKASDRAADAIELLL